MEAVHCRRSRLPGQGADGRPIHGSGHPICHRPQAGRRASLRESETKLRAVFDQTIHFIAVLALDGTLVMVNRAALAFTGAKDSDAYGKPFWETPWWSHSIELREQTPRRGENCL